MGSLKRYIDDIDAETIRRAGRAVLARVSRRRAIAVGATALALLAALFLWRLSRTAEFIAAFGDDSERFALCRVAPGLSAARRRRVLDRLLGDPVESVRVAAATAVGMSPSDDELDGRLERMLLDGSEPHAVRVRAGEVLLGRRRARGTVLRYVRGRSSDPRFVRDFSSLVAGYLVRELDRADPRVRRRILARTFDPADPLSARLRQTVLDRVDDFSPFREDFVAALGSGPDFRTRSYVVAALAAVDGMMRGQHADDWRAREVGRLGEGRPFVFEAEWAHDIRPNYHIAEKEGVLCLALGEGAGGNMAWRKGVEGSADIGSARWNLLAPSDGAYSVWARVYFGDKCGNSFFFFLNGRQFANFPDSTNTMARWHWLRLLATSASQETPMFGESGAVRLKAGIHRGRLMAREDDVFIDRFALLPAGSSPEALPEEPAILWDDGLASSLSFDVTRQTQPRGTTQFVTVWVRRNSPGLTEGRVTLAVPGPFEIEGARVMRVRFAEGNPLCRTSFRVRLPADAPAGEGFMTAVYEESRGGGAEGAGRPGRIEGRFILGAHPDWLTTGPLSPGDALSRKLARATTVADGELDGRWAPYPAKGYDIYRRLDFEKAYGHIQNVYIHLVADVEVAEAGRYEAFLSADDTAYVFIDGRLAISQPEGGPAESRMETSPVRLDAGRHRVFVRHYQADFPDPEGYDRLRKTANQCAFKLLLRKRRHEPAPGIRWLPMPRR